jgi:hypothetical protein
MKALIFRNLDRQYFFAAKVAIFPIRFCWRSMGFVFFVFKLPDIRPFSISGIRTDIRKVNYGIRPDIKNVRLSGRLDIRCNPGNNIPVPVVIHTAMLPILDYMSSAGPFLYLWYCSTSSTSTVFLFQVLWLSTIMQFFSELPNIDHKLFEDTGDKPYHCLGHFVESPVQ